MRLSHRQIHLLLSAGVILSALLSIAGSMGWPPCSHAGQTVAILTNLLWIWES